MLKNTLILVVLAIFVISCQTGKEEAKKFSADYKATVEKLKEKRALVKTRDEYVAYNEEKKKSLEDLLNKYQESPDIEEIEILRTKILLDLDDLDKAEEKIDTLLAEEPDLINEARMVKVNVLIKRKQYGDAYNIFKDIESKISDRNDLFTAYFYIGQEHEDLKIKEEYTKKFLDGQDIPENLDKLKYQMQANLADIAAIEGDMEKARTILNEGIAITEDQRQKTYLEMRLGQLDSIGKKAFPLSKKNWFNSSPQNIDQLKGKVVVLFFWATWCPHCRSMYPLIIETYDKYVDQGLVVIGATRLYGIYRDDEVDKGKVEKDEEIELIKKYIERKGIRLPMVVAEDKADFDSYQISGLPTMVFIDREGNIDFFKVGSGDTGFIKEKIKKLVEEV